MDNKIYPFKFLDSYTVADKDIFFGRDEEVRQLYQMIYQSDILLLYGASGTGKTSLIQCGLASQFQQHDWLDVFIRRHNNLNESLRKALIAVGGEGANSTDSLEEEDWLDHLMEEGQETAIHQPLSPTQTFLKNIYLQHFRPIYLIFDQFEELFILGNKAEQNQFIATIQEILAVEQPVKLIFSIREEYLGSLYEFEKVVPELLRKKLRIDPMNFEKAKAVILGATNCQKSIVHLEPTEADAIAEQVFEKIRGKDKTLTIQLPYLQVFLDKYYRHISKDKAKNPSTEATFTLAALQEIGDIGNILRDFLDEQILEIAKQQHCDPKTIWTILSPFVTVDGTKEPIGITALHQQLPDVRHTHIEQVVLALMNNRILRYLEEAELYEVAHDSLALRIAEKRSDDDIALLEVRHLIKTQSLLKDEARELFSEKQLEFIAPYLKQIQLNAEEAQLLEASREQVAQLKQEAHRKKLLLLVLAALVFIIISAFAIYSQQAKNNALEANEKNERIVGAMDFYDDKYALAVNNGKYGFIDKNGVSNLNIEFIYDKGEPFDSETGYAEMEIKMDNNKYQKYLIDTVGNSYKLIKIADFLKNSETTTTIFSEKELAWFKKKLSKRKTQRATFDKIESLERDIKSSNSQLIKVLQKDTTKLALDFSGLTKTEVLTLTQKMLAIPDIKDKVELLFLNSTDLDTLPIAISGFKNLKWLDLKQTNITNFPSSIKDLKHLTSFNLSYVNVFPRKITSIKNLNSLSISGTFGDIPENIKQLKELKTLYLLGSTSSFPKSILNLTKLEDLYIYGDFENFPDSLIKLHNLIKLSIHGPFKTLPENIGKLSNLKELVVSGPFETLPENIGELSNLQLLNIMGDFEIFPKSIGQLINLKHLNIMGGFKTLPKEFYALKNIEVLHLEYSLNIREVPHLNLFTKLKNFHYTLNKNEHYNKNKAILQAFQKENPNCSLYIQDENGGSIDLSKD